MATLNAIRRAKNAIALGAISLALGFMGMENASAETATCQAPDVSRHMYISPDCNQKWTYFLYQIMGPTWFQPWSDSIYAQIEKSSNDEERRKLMLKIISFTDVMSKGKSIAVGSEVTKLLVESGIKQVAAKEIVDYLFAIPSMAAGDESVAFKKLWALMVNEWTLVEAATLKNKMNALVVAQTYLQELYRFGGDEQLLAVKYGLSASATAKERLEAVARRRLGLRQFLNNPLISDYNIVETWQFVQAFANHAIAPTMTFCSAAPDNCMIFVSGTASSSTSEDSTAVSPPSTSASSVCKEPVVKEGISGQDAQAALGPALDKDRADAIYYLVKGGKFRIPQCGPELGLALTGATEAHRARAIQALAGVVQSNLSGEDAAAILGTAKECSEKNRADAIYYLAKANKFKPILSGKELEMILDGTTGAARARAIQHISEASK